MGRWRRLVNYLSSQPPVTQPWASTGDVGHVFLLELLLAISLISIVAAVCFKRLKRPAALSTTFRRTTPSGPLWVPIGGLPLLHNVTWLHVPKCGSTFENVLLRGACRASTKHPFIEAHDVHDILASHCPTAFNRFESGHEQLRPSDLREGVQRVTLLRKPASRATSGFFAGLHSCRTMQHLISPRLSPGGWACTIRAPPETRAWCNPQTAPPGSFYATFTDEMVREYARCISGCAANMIAGRYCEANASATIVSEAVNRLRGFEFVGIQDDWNATIETFGCRYAVPLHPSDYETMRPGYKPSSYARVRAIMEAFVFDDEPIYREGLRHLERTRAGTICHEKKGL